MSLAVLQTAKDTKTIQFHRLWINKYVTEKCFLLSLQYWADVTNVVATCQQEPTLLGIFASLMYA